jgi:hypothetical protein
VIAAFNGIGWLILFLFGLAILQRRVHFEFQAIFLLLTKNVDFTILLFSITFLPGVLLHELSHFIMAKLLRVPTGRFSILPKPLTGGKLQLGYVETSGTDIFRDSLIGFAPLLAGTSTIAYISFLQLDISSILDTSGKISLGLTRDIISQMYNQPDFWIWFYLILVISSTMFPSTSDRRSWIPLIVLLVGLIVVGVLFGGGPWIMQNVAPGLNQLFLGLSSVFGVSTLIHLLLLIPLWALRSLLVQITGMKIA